MNNIGRFATLTAMAVTLVGCSTNEDRIPSLCESFSEYFPVGVMINRSIVRSMNDTNFIIKHYNILLCLSYPAYFQIILLSLSPIFRQ